MAKFTLPSLPYEYDALEPHFDAQTMEIHHTKHHQGYTDKLNTALEKQPELAELEITDLLKNLNNVSDEIRPAVQNNGGGFYNHTLFWPSLSPDGGKMIEGIEKAIAESFGSVDAFKDQFTTQAATLFGSGWTWLVHSDGKLSIVQTSNQDNPIMTSSVKVLLGLDVWEHAYYLKYQNRRPEYVEAWWNIINWEEVERRMLE